MILVKIKLTMYRDTLKEIYNIEYKILIYKRDFAWNDPKKLDKFNLTY